MDSRPLRGVFASAALSLACLMPLAAGAEDDQNEQYRREGYYLSASAIYAHDQFRDTDGFSVDNAWGYSFAGGLRMNRLAAIEIEVETPIQGFALDLDPGVTGRPDDIVTSIMMFNAKLHMPFGRVEPFLMYGIGMMYANPSPAGHAFSGSLNKKGPRVDFAFQGGGGVDIYITPSVALTFDANYVLPTDRLKVLTHVTYSAGIKYRFGSRSDDDE